MKNNNGFTMNELMIVLAIVGIMATMAFPVFSRITARSKLNAAARDMHAVLTQARMSAMRDGRKTTVTITKNKVVMTQENPDKTLILLKTLTTDTKISFSPDTAIIFSSVGIAQKKEDLTVTDENGKKMTVQVGIGGLAKIVTPPL